MESATSLARPDAPTPQLAGQLGAPAASDPAPIRRYELHYPSGEHRVVTLDQVDAALDGSSFPADFWARVSAADGAFAAGNATSAHRLWDVSEQLTTAPLKANAPPAARETEQVAAGPKVFNFGRRSDAHG